MPEEVDKEQYKLTRNSYHAAKRRVQYPTSFADRTPATMVATWWVSFAAFAKDMGLRPEKNILCRINQTLPYSKDNCKWLPLDACRREQGMCSGSYTEQGLPQGMVDDDGVVRADTPPAPEVTGVWVDEAASISDETLAEIVPKQTAESAQAEPDTPTNHDMSGDTQPVQVAAEDDPKDLFEDFDQIKETEGGDEPA